MLPHVALETMATELKTQIDLDLLFKFKEILLDTVEFSEQGQGASVSQDR